MGMWLVGEYTDVDNGETLDLIGDEAGQPGMVRVLFHDGEDVMPRATLDHQFILNEVEQEDWAEMELEAEGEGPDVLARFRMIRARHAA